MATSICAATAAALHYTALLLFAGFLCFKTAIARGHWPPHPRHRLLTASGAVAVAAAALAVPLGALDAAALPPTRIADVPAWSGLVRSGPVLVAALSALGIGAAYACFTRSTARWSRPAALALASPALAAPALTGHTRSFDPGRLMIAADLVHLFAGAVWLGGLAGLLVLLRAAHAERPAVDAASAARVVARFSAWAGATVAALGASGLVMALVIHRTWSSLLESEHGLALLVKLNLVAVALALAACNRYLLVPAVRTASGERAGLRRVLLAEAAAVVLAAAATGALVGLSPGSH